MSTLKVKKITFLVVFSQILMIFAIFFTFNVLIVSYRNVVERRATTHFAQNFELYQMEVLKMKSDIPFQKLKIGSSVFPKRLLMKSSFKFSNVLQSIENFMSYRNHYLHLMQKLVFIEKIQWQRGAYNIGKPCIWFVYNVNLALGACLFLAHTQVFSYNFVKFEFHERITSAVRKK